MSNKKLFFIVIALVAVIGVGCTTKVVTQEKETTDDNAMMQEEKTNANDIAMMQKDAAPMEASEADTTYVVSTEDSSIQWTGYKIIPKSEHFGSINFESGEVAVDADGAISAARFVVDMNSIVDEDVEDEKMNERLVGHLKSEDFFNTADYATAELVVTNIAALEGREDGVTHQVAANLTIKGITHNVTFPATITVENGVLNAQATVEFDRTLWDVQFGSLKFGPDAIVEDVIKLDVAVVAQVQ